jgi:hypothetical protein
MTNLKIDRVESLPPVRVRATSGYVLSVSTTPSLSAQTFTAHVRRFTAPMPMPSPMTRHQLLMAEGYRESASEDVRLAEEGIWASYEVLPD